MEDYGLELFFRAVDENAWNESRRRLTDRLLIRSVELDIMEDNYRREEQVIKNFSYAKGCCQDILRYFAGLEGYIMKRRLL